MSPQQMFAIETLAHQKLFALVTVSCLRENGGAFEEEFTQVRGKGRPSHNFIRRGDDIELHAHFASDWRDLPEEERSVLIQAPAYDARLLLLRDGRVQVLSAVFGVAPEGTLARYVDDEVAGPDLG